MIAADLLVTLFWPLAAVTLVLCGMTLATGSSSARAVVSDRRAVGTAEGGRRATDRLPGERTMVVVTGDSSADTIRRAMSAARGDGGAATGRASGVAGASWESRS